MPASDKTGFQSRRHLENERIKNPLKPKISKRKRVAAFLNKITLREKIIRNKKKVIVVSVVLLLVAGIGAVYDYYQYTLENSPVVIYQRRVQSITQQVKRFVKLTVDEKPVFATVTDTSVLPKVPFFLKAQNGDKIIMYKKHKLAILFRPITGQVITKATLVFRDVTPTPQEGLGNSTVVGASTSAKILLSPVEQSTPTLFPKRSYHPQGKILVSPQ